MTPAARLKIGLYSAWLDYRRGPPFIAKPQEEPHICNTSCAWFERPPVFICRSSGNLHLCSERVCDQLVHTHDSLVCRVTATAYPLPFNESSYSDNVDYARREAGGDTIDGGMDELIDRGGEPGDTNEPVSMDFMDCLVDELFEPVAPPAPQLKAAKRTPAKRVKRKERKPRAACLSSEATDYEQQRIYSTVIRKVYELNKSDPPPSAVVDYYVALCSSLWRLIVGSPHFSSKSFSYKVEYHALVVLYNFCGGFEFDTMHNTKVCLIDSRMDIANRLPVVGALTGVYVAATSVAIRTSHYTSAERFFRDAVSSVSAQQLIAYIDDKQVCPFGRTDDEVCLRSGCTSRL